MLFIVTYHFLCYIYLYESGRADTIIRGAWIPLHVAVICFVLISGYFHIRPSVKGAVKLLLPPIFFFSIPNVIATACGADIGFFGGVKSLLFLSQSPYWFIRTYLYLFLISPILNKYLDECDTRHKIVLICILAFIAVIEGLLGDPSLKDGKNLPMFMLVYVVGDFLRDKQCVVDKIKILHLSLGWVIFNICLVVIWMLIRNVIWGKVLWHLCFPYNSPLLIINSIWFFMIFSRLTLNSTKINAMAASVFSIYILQGQPILRTYLINPLLSYIYHGTCCNFFFLVEVLMLALLVVLFGIMLDISFKPLFSFIQKKVEIINRIK